MRAGLAIVCSAVFGGFFLGCSQPTANPDAGPAAPVATNAALPPEPVESPAAAASIPPSDRTGMVAVAVNDGDKVERCIQIAFSLGEKATVADGDRVTKELAATRASLVDDATKNGKTTRVLSTTCDEAFRDRPRLATCVTTKKEEVASSSTLTRFYLFDAALANDAAKDACVAAGGKWQAPLPDSKEFKDAEREAHAHSAKDAGR